MILTFLQFLAFLFLGVLSLQPKVRHHCYAFLGVTIFLVLLPGLVSWVYGLHFSLWILTGYEVLVTTLLTVYHVSVVLLWTRGWEAGR